ncbi:MAG: ATP-dependent DNA helicase RecQ, partial [Spirochaetaceae bacterium]
MTVALARDVDLQRELLRIYGYREFRPNQREVIDALLCGRDVFVVMPTGGGKSLCYQLPAAISNGFTLVISPLIALMKDQVDAARANGIRAGVLNSSLEPAERAQTLDAMAADPGSEQALDLLYVAPERFADAAFSTLLQRRPPALIAIDEAHCVSEWGHDFRPDYLRLGELTARCPGVPVAAFTA